MLNSHMSVSQVGRFLSCPLQYKFAYIDKIKAPIRVRTAIGKGFHKSYESNFLYKIKWGKDLSFLDLIDIYDLEIKKIKEEEEIEKEEDVDFETGKDMIRLYYPLANKIKPEFVEKEFELNIKGVGKFIGVIDLTTKRKEIIDYKISKMKPTREGLENDLQYLVYSLGYYKIKDKKKAKEFQFHYVRPLKTPRIEIVNLPFPSKKQIDYTLTIIKRVGKAIEVAKKTGNFYPSFNPMVCSWCGYKDRCRQGRW